MAMNVGGAIAPAITHTKRVLFGPFALRKWLALGFVSLLAEFGQGGAHFNLPGNSSGSDEIGRTLYQWIEHHLALIIAGAVLLFLIGLTLQWLGSVMRFVYLNQITRDPYTIREPFSRLKHLGTSFFLWRLAFGLIAVLAMALLVGLPILGLFMTHTSSSTPAVVVVVIWGFLVGLPLLLGVAVIDIFARYFTATAMFARKCQGDGGLENRSAHHQAERGTVGALSAAARRDLHRDGLGGADRAFRGWHSVPDRWGAVCADRLRDLRPREDTRGRRL